jgi:alkaline phosphatase
MKNKKPGVGWKYWLMACLIINGSILFAQPVLYSVSNAHSHNDYEQKVPYWLAYQAGYGSIEADIFLVDSVLYVAHDNRELERKIKLETEYLIPIVNCLKENKGRPYPGIGKKLQILIDIKSDSLHTLAALIEMLKKYPSLINNRSLTWVITGNRPDESLFGGYPDFIAFDGELHKDYSVKALSKILLMSDDFRNYSLWKGDGNLPGKDDSVLVSAVSKSHRLKKPVRFWDSPDMISAWHQLELLKVDYINTDHIQALAEYLKQ